MEGLLEALDRSSDQLPHVDEDGGLRRFIPKQGHFKIYEKGTMRNMVHLKLDFYELDDLSVKCTLERNLRFSLENNEKLIAEFTARIIELESQTIVLEERNVQIADLKAQLEIELKLSCKLKEELSVLNSKIRTLESELDSITEKVRVVEFEKTKLEKSSSELNKVNVELSAQNTYKDQLIKDLKEQLKKSETKVTQLESKFQDLQGENLQLVKLKMSSENQVEKLQVEIEGLKLQQENDKTRISNLNELLSELRGDLDDLKADRNSVVVKLTTVEARLLESERDIIGYRAEIDHSHHEKIDLKIQLDKKIQAL